MKIAEGLHHIGFPTADMDATVEFYQSLGGEVVFAKEEVEAGRPIQVRIIDFYGTLIECYERAQTPMRDGAIDHLAFRVEDVDALYGVCKQRGYRFMDECADEVGRSGYWPKRLKWFIVYGPNEEKIEFCRQG